MSAGQKFELSFDEDAQSGEIADVSVPSGFVSDVFERQTATTSPPTAPALKNKTGFPAHTKRTIQSRFKQKRQDDDSRSLASQMPESRSNTADKAAQDNVAMSDRAQIDKENRDRLASMSPEEIEEARRELLGAMDPALLQRILQRADISSGSNEAADIREIETSAPSEEPISEHPRQEKKVTFAVDEEEEEITQPDVPPQDSIHFPRAPQPPDLDPNSETFLDDLHSKYFPSLPAEPDKLEWMRASKSKNTYDPSQSALSPRDIRFDFSGALLAPSAASEIPVSAGLHHHADAPEAAGYTIPELAHLSRSTYAPQRCIAFQTLGRILYKLGKGEFGDPGEPGANTVGAEDTMGELARGLWREIETQHVIEQLVAESEGNGIDGGRHVSARTYATEAVWLWRQGGGRRWKAD
ncbi:hypothetical protein AMS68_005681 [Peltaster fructicola]|uniref:RNA polymerase II-associated protein 1 N-terminal domain-containing protein n=1 Tax=Peltaster fructicola TaxID=286661 RepID=A0A6H0XZI2_9PEZI|nr:hypothetical protein AMS68_005681 [Peltaster fructicola]